jgi:hypothetical protein
LSTRRKQVKIGENTCLRCVLTVEFLNAMPTLTKIEQTILDILSDFPGYEASERDLRTLVQNRGFRRSAPAFVLTMENLADKGLVSCREEVRKTDVTEVRDRYYLIRNGSG